MRGLKISTLLLSLLLSIPNAQASGKKTKETSERTAKKACLSGDVDKGVDILTDLYIETNDAAYIYNQGRCYEQNLRYKEALARFREYLVKAVNASAKERADAEQHSATCESYLAISSPASPQSRAPEPANPAVTEPARPVPSAPEKSTVLPPQEPAAEVRQTEPEVPTGSGLRTAGVVTATFGGAALVAGVVLNIQVNSMAREMEADGAYSRSKESRRATYATLGWVAYGVGAACVATGAALYFLGRSHQPSSTSSSVALVPAFAPGNVGAILEGSF